jgi:methionine-rich copper-binding protein CopC/putative copper export protein
MRRLLLIIGFCLVLIPVGRASAHATPVLYVPAASSVLERAPAAVSIRFSERVENGVSGISLYAPDGRTLDSAASVDKANPYTLQAVFPAAGTGTYAVSWQVVSADDGHFTKGAYAFSVGAESGTDAAGGTPFQLLHRSDTPEAFTIWLELLGQAVALGAIAVFALFARPLLTAQPGERRRVTRAYLMLLILGALAMICGTILYEWLKASELQSDRGGTFTQSIMLFLATSAGSAAALRLLIATALLLSVLGVRRAMRSVNFTVWEGAQLCLLAMMAFSRAGVSHAAASASPVFAITVNWLHLLSKELWIGAVPAFLWICFPSLQRVRDRALHLQASTGLSRLLTAAFALGGLTGLYITWLHLKGFGNILRTHWSMGFLSLAVTAVLLVTFRLYQQIVVDAELAGVTRKATPLPETVGSSWMALLAEALIGGIVLFLSSALIITTPPLNAGQTFQRHAQSQGVQISLADDPDDARMLLLSFAGGYGKAIATLRNDGKGIGPVLVPLTPVFHGGYTLPRSLLTPVGAWTMDVTLQRPGSYDAVAQFAFHAPDDLLAPEAVLHAPSLTLVSVLLACVFLTTALCLWRRARRLSRMPMSGSYGALPLPLGWKTAPFIAAALCVLFAFLLYHLERHGHGGFSPLCIRNGHLWHESVPIRDGKATGTEAVMGCMLGSGRGQQHFSDERQYAWFTRPAAAIADLGVSPPSPVPGKAATLRFFIHDASGAAVTDLAAEHDRLLHVAVLGDDLQTLAHLHPEDFGPVTSAIRGSGTYAVQYTFPHPGRYLVAIDFTERAQPFAQEFYVTVPGKDSPAAAVPDVPGAGSFQGYNVHLSTDGPVTSGKPVTLRYAITKDGKPVRDLEPYLAAPMHLLIARQDLREYQHAHAEIPQTFWESILTPRTIATTHTHAYLPDRFGPDLEALVQFPQPGTYLVFGEFRHQGKIIQTRFVLRVN